MKKIIVELYAIAYRNKNKVLSIRCDHCQNCNQTSEERAEESMDAGVQWRVEESKVQEDRVAEESGEKESVRGEGGRGRRLTQLLLFWMT